MAPTPVSISNSDCRKRIVNFAAGPSKLPEPVLALAQTEFMNYQGTECSLMELSHRGSLFTNVLNDAASLIRELLDVPDNYKVIFMQGGGSGQFAAIPLNFISRSSQQTADYIVTGRWSEAAAKEASKFAKVHTVFPEAPTEGFSRIPDESSWTYSEDPAYVFFCDNETVHGVEFADIPTPPPGVPLVADMSSNLMSRRIDISQFGLVFAGAQKNLGPAGLTIVIVREDLLGNALPYTPSVFNYQVMAKNNSLYNTPPTYSIYITGLVLKWVKDNGGIDKMSRNADEKANSLYGLVDESGGFYLSPVESKYRSRMNVVFKIPSSETLEKQFIEDAAKLGLVELKGHRSVGGLRASVYNAVSIDDVSRLADFMRDFQRTHTCQGH